jgi:hypothetical protein
MTVQKKWYSSSEAKSVSKHTAETKITRAIYRTRQLITGSHVKQAARVLFLGSICQTLLIPGIKRMERKRSLDQDVQCAHLNRHKC